MGVAGLAWLILGVGLSVISGWGLWTIRGFFPYIVACGRRWFDSEC